MIRGLALAASLLSASQAAALTCARPDPIRAFQDAQAAPETYQVLYGRLSFDPGRMPTRDGRDAPMPAPVGARFSGLALGLTGFTRPVDAAVTLQPTCAGPWCGSIGPGVVLLFAEVTDAGYVVELGPCGGGAFDQVSEAMLERLASCMRGEACQGNATP